LNDPLGIAVSGRNLFVATVDGTIGDYNTTGTTVDPSLIEGLNLTGAIAVSGSNLFVGTTSAREGPVDAIAEYTTSGALLNTSLITGLDTPVGIAISDNRVSVPESFPTLWLVFPAVGLFCLARCCWKAA
jgi:hypothetical protein